MRILKGVVALFLAVLPALALAQPAAEIVTLQGKGDYSDTPSTNWRPAQVKQALKAGQYVRTSAPGSKMGLLLADQTKVTLQDVEIVQVKSPETAGPRKSILEFGGKGKAGFETKTPSKALTIGTPGGLAAIRGTEWVVEIDDAGKSSFTVVEGELEIYNDLGRIPVGVDEQGFLEPGKAPYKVRLQNARERVQWVSSFRLDPSRYGQAQADRELFAAETDLYMGRVGAALERLGNAATRFPGDARIPALTAQAALMADDFARARAAVAEALAKHPNAVETHLAAGEVARLDGDSAGARRAFRRATQIAPGDWRGWHGLGQVQSERGHPRAARSALAEADKLSPQNARVLGEQGLVEANAYDLPRSRELLDRALGAQPDDFSSWTALGYTRLKSGDTDGAVEALLKATLIEPRFAKAHVYLAVAYWQQRRDGDALAQLRTASLHDPKDPLPYQMAAMIQSDLMRPGDALASARESVARLPFVKSLDAVANNLRGGANLGAPLAQLGLESWALKNAQDSFDPLWAGSHLFLADRLPGKFFGNSELMQGFLTDPLAFGASNRFQTLISRPGAYGTLAMRASQSSDSKLVEPLANANGLAMDGRFAYFLEGSYLHAWPDNGQAKDAAASFTVGLGAKLRDDLGVFFYGNRLFPESRNGHGNGSFDPYSLIDGVAQRIDAGAHYRPSPDWQVWIKGGHGYEESLLDERTVTQVGTVRSKRESHFTTDPRRSDLGTRFSRRFANGMECFATVEGAVWKAYDFLERDAFGRVSDTAARSLESVKQEIRDESTSFALGGRWPISPAFQVEADVDYTKYEKTNDILVRRDFANQLTPLTDNHERDQWSPRAGIVARPIEGLTLRGAYQEWLRPAAQSSLKPSSTAGIVLDERYVLPGGRFERAKAQVEWEARPTMLVTAFYDRQEIDNLYSSLIGVLNNRPDSSNLERLRNRSFNALASLEEVEGFAELSRGELRESGFSVNALATRQVSLFAEGVWAQSENTGTYPGKKLAFSPRHRYALGGTFFSDDRWSLGLKGTYRAERFTNEANTQRLQSEWSAAVQAYWETRDKRLSIEVILLNLAAKTADEAVGIAINYRF